MRLYPAYTLRDVMDEYAITFSALLAEGYRLKYQDYLMHAQLNDLPMMKQSERNKFYKNLEWASTHPDDILNTSGDYDDIEQLRKFFGGKR